jgi:hypothetical protein
MKTIKIENGQLFNINIVELTYWLKKPSDSRATPYYHYHCPKCNYEAIGTTNHIKRHAITCKLIKE